MKRTIRLTERDLTRIVRRVINEKSGEEIDPNDDMINHFLKNPKQMQTLKASSGDYAISLEGADEKTTMHVVKRFLNSSKSRDKFIVLENCDELDFSGMDLCGKGIVSIKLNGTPNNFEETQGDCFEKIDNDHFSDKG